LLLGLFRPATADRRAGWVTLFGLAGLSVWAFLLQPGATLFGGSFVLDPLALFAQRLFLVSAVVSVLATLGLPGERFKRRGAEYHVAILASLLGMLVLAAARELVLLFVAVDLMAIPQKNVKRMLAYSGIAHIGYMLMGIAAMSANGAGMVLFYLVAYLFGNMGAFLVVQAVGAAEGSDRMDAYRGLAQRSP